MAIDIMEKYYNQISKTHQTSKKSPKNNDIITSIRPILTIYIPIITTKIYISICIYYIKRIALVCICTRNA
jgi:hypothetical protein